MVRSLCAALIVLTFAAATSAADEATPVGVWAHPNGRIHMQVSPCGKEFCAKLTWFKSPNDDEGKPRLDVNNPDPALRSRPLLGLQVLHGLHSTAEGAWEGTVYNPDDGDDYSAEMSIEPDGTLRVRGYVLDPLFGKTLIWTRVK